LEAQNGIGHQEDKEDLERSGENGLGQEDLERCGHRPMPPGGQNVKKKNGLGYEGLERCGRRPMPPGGQKVKKNMGIKSTYLLTSHKRVINITKVIL
jgi:hypothetical protein